MSRATWYPGTFGAGDPPPTDSEHAVAATSRAASSAGGRQLPHLLAGRPATPHPFVVLAPLAGTPPPPGLTYRVPFILHPRCPGVKPSFTGTAVRRRSGGRKSSKVASGIPDGWCVPLAVGGRRAVVTAMPRRRCAGRWRI